MFGSFNFITHFKDGSREETLFNTQEELFEFVLARSAELEQTPDISISFSEFGPIQ